MFKFNVLWLLCTSKDNAHVMVSGHTGPHALPEATKPPLMANGTGGEETKDLRIRQVAQARQRYI